MFLSFFFSFHYGMQVMVLQEKLAEKDHELQILKETLQQPKSPILEDKVNSPPPTENDEAIISGDAEKAEIK